MMVEIATVIQVVVAVVPEVLGVMHQVPTVVPVVVQ